MKSVIQLVAIFAVFASVCWCTDVPVRQEPCYVSRQLKKAPTTKSTKAPTWGPTATPSTAPASCEPDLLVDISIATQRGEDNALVFQFIDVLTNTSLKIFSGFNQTLVKDSFSIPLNGCTKLTAIKGAVTEEESNSASASVVLAGAAFFFANSKSPPMLFGLGCTRGG